MTDRPTGAAVHEALSFVARAPAAAGEHAAVLAAEVRALRVQLAAAHTAYNLADRARVEARAAITRVDELCGMNHVDSLLRVGDIRDALHGAGG